MKNFYLFCCCLFLFTATYAQELEPSDDLLTEDFFTLSLEDLMNMEIESAGKKAEKISDIPASVVVITRDEIEKLGYISLEDILENIPGLYSLGDAFIYGGNNYGVRGFASSGTFNDMMIMINGVNQMEDFANSYSTDRILVPIESIDRIEVIRGPMAVMYGSSAFMGTINIITNEHQEGKKHNKVSGTVASLGTMNTYGRFSAKQEDFSYTVNVNYAESQGREIKLSDMVSTHSNTDDKTTLDGKSTHADFSAQYKGVNFGMNYSSQTEAAMGIGVPTSPYYYANESFLFNIGYKKEVSNTITLEGKFNANNNSLELPNEDEYAIFKVRTKAYEYEVNTYLNFSKKYNGVIGLYNRVAYDIERFVDMPARGFYNFENNVLDNISSKAAFVQFNAQPIEKLKLVAGVRFEETNNYRVNALLEIPVAVTTSDTTPPTIVNNTIQKDYGNINQGGLQIIPRFAAIYSINDNHVLKLLYGESKKRSSFVQSVNLNPLQDNDLAIANMNTLELNYLSTISSKVGINFSVFYNDLNNLITRDFTITNTGNIIVDVNASGELQTLGSELTVKYVPIKKLHIELSGTYQNSKNQANTALELAYAPQFLGYLKAHYTIGEKMTVGLKARYVATMKGEINNLNQQRFSEDAPAYTIADVNFRYNNIWKGLYFSGTINNVLGQEIRYASYQNTSWADKGIIGFNRRFFATIGYEF